ncbi:MAG: IS21 family transposase [Syntrophobacteraceae bacterium]
MPQINSIKEMARDGQSVAGIARELSVDEKTVRKYLVQEDFSPRPPNEAARASKLDPHKKLIDTWLEEDQGRWHKQRHTAKRIHDRLKTESPGYDCAYNAVQRYVKDTLRAQRALRASQELVWHPGESQCDFGEADFRERGELVRKKYLTLSFPHSNNSLTQVFGGETAECVCQGLKDIFDYLGGVTPIIVFDNATGVGRRVGEVIHEAKLFQRMRAHYGFSVRFCNPESGYEKGNVESKIGYTRRNLFVPEPEFDDIEAYNRQLLDLHAAKAEEAHYKKLLPIRQLFEADSAALMPLPRMVFDAVRYEYIKSDGYGKVRIDAKHHYSTCPEYAGQEVLVAIRAHTIDILGKDKQLLVKHIRHYGAQRSDTCDYRTSLAVLMNNAGAWQNSGIRELVPAALKDTMDSQPRDELRATLRTMHHLTVTYSFETALQALEEGLRINRTAFCDAAALAARISGYGLDVAPGRGQDLHVYDELLLGIGQS